MTEIQQPSIRAALVVARAQMPAWLVSAALLAVLALTLVVQRCWVGAHMDFETDEAYYWMWSRWLAPSYYDHPPMVAYLIRLGTLLFGDSLLGIRSMAILATIAAYVLLYILAVVLFDDQRIGLIAALWFSMTPLAAFFSVVMFPDTPAILFWVATCVAAALIWRTAAANGGTCSGCPRDCCCSANIPRCFSSSASPPGSSLRKTCGFGLADANPISPP